MFQLAALPTANPLPLAIDPIATIAAETPGTGASADTPGAAFETMLAAKLDPAPASDGKPLPLPTGNILPPELPQMDMPAQPMTATASIAVKLRLARHNAAQAKPAVPTLSEVAAEPEQSPGGAAAELPTDAPHTTQALPIVAFSLIPAPPQQPRTAKPDKAERPSVTVQTVPPSKAKPQGENAAIGAISPVLAAVTFTPLPGAPPEEPSPEPATNPSQISAHITQPQRWRAAATTKATAEVISPLTAPAPVQDALPIRQTLIAENAAPAPPVFQQTSTATPIDQPATAPATPAATDTPRDFATLIETLVQSREAASPRPVQVIMPHAEFGKVSLRFDSDDTGLSVTMTSPDPAFASAVQAALPAERSAASGDNTAPRQDNTGDAPTQSRSSSSSGDRQSSDPRPRQHNGSEARAQPRSEARSGRSNPRQDEVFA